LVVIVLMSHDMARPTHGESMSEECPALRLLPSLAARWSRPTTRACLPRWRWPTWRRHGPCRVGECPPVEWLTVGRQLG